MANSAFRDYGLLNRWPIIMAESVYRFNQVAGSGVQVTDNSNPLFVYVQYERDYLASALNSAVNMAAPYLGYYPRPTFVSEEIVFQSGQKWDYQILETKTGYLKAFGSRAVSLLDDDVAVVYSGALATITVTHASIGAMDTDEIQVFFRVTDGADVAASEQWGITPLAVTKSGNTATITGHRGMFVKPSVWATPFTAPNYFDRNAADVTDANNFVTLVDVYRVYPDPTNAAVVISDPADSVSEVAVSASIRDPRLGQFRLAEDATAPVKPRRVRVSYQAGYPLTNGLMQSRLEVAMIRLANTLVPQEPGDGMMRMHAMFAADNLPRDAGLRSGRDFWSPPEFGYKEGAWAAWDVIWSMRVVEKSIARQPDELKYGRSLDRVSDAGG